MKIFENYNTAKQKYGSKLVIALSEAGVPPKYLLSACRYIQEKHVPIERIKQLFRRWMTYVVKNNRNIDVNKLSFEEFFQTIQKYKSEYGIPNKVYYDGQVSIGKINSPKDINRFPIKNTWCIKQPGMFQKYSNNGYSFYIIDNGDESDYIRYVILMVGKDGKKYYYDLDNTEMTQDSVLNFQSHLTNKSLSFIQNINENNQYNNINMKQTIKLTESELRSYIADAVKKCLRENSEKINPKSITVHHPYYDEDIPYIDNEPYYDEYGVPNVHSKRKSKWDDPEHRMNAYGEYRNKYGHQITPNKERLHTLNRQTDAFGSFRPHDNAYFADGDLYPSAEFVDNQNIDWNNDATEYLDSDAIKRFKKSLDKQWKDTRDMEKYSRQADSRPLHRKGSLNRAMDDWHGKK